MNWILSLLAFQTLTIPAYSPPDAFPPADPARLSLVVATTVSETDPQPLCDRPNCTALFLGRYQQGVTLAGAAFAAEFTARVEMGSPWIRPYRLAMIVEDRPGQEPLVRAMAGFSSRTGLACFEDDMGWSPEGPGVARVNGELCVREGAPE